MRWSRIPSGGLHCLAALASLTLAAGAAGAAGAATFVAAVGNINPALPDSNLPGKMAPVGPRCIMVASDGSHGQELYRLDAAVPEATFVTDLNPIGDGFVGSALVAYQNGVAFRGNDNVDGEELWFSDGSEAGTNQIANITPSSGGTSIAQLLARNVDLFFVKSGTDFWTSNGTSAGTGLVAAGRGLILGLYDQLVMLGPELATSSGVIGGGATTVGPSGSLFAQPGTRGIEYRSRFFFYGHESPSVAGNEPWVTDGVAGAQTFRVADLNSGPGDSNTLFAGATYFEGSLYFVASEPGTGQELYKFDDQAATRLTDLIVGSASGVVRILGVVGRRLLFVGNTAATGNELWSIDASDNVALVADLAPGSSSSLEFVQPVDGFRAGGDRGYLWAHIGSTDTLLVTDGTKAGTLRVWGSPQRASTLEVAGGRLYFLNMEDPWALDLFDQRGTTACRSPHAPVPDNDVDGTTDALEIDHDVTFNELEVSLDIEHRYAGDLIVTLTHVDTGTTITLLDVTTNCSGDDIQITLSDRAAATAATNCTTGVGVAWPRSSTWKPNSPLAAFAGQSTAGKWMLRVTDAESLDLGVLHSWCLGFRAPEVISDGFESGTFGGWLAVLPTPAP